MLSTYRNVMRNRDGSRRWQLLGTFLTSETVHLASGVRATPALDSPVCDVFAVMTSFIRVAQNLYGRENCIVPRSCRGIDIIYEIYLFDVGRKKLFLCSRCKVLRIFMHFVDWTLVAYDTENKRKSFLKKNEGL